MKKIFFKELLYPKFFPLMIMNFVFIAEVLLAPSMMAQDNLPEEINGKEGKQRKTDFAPPDGSRSVTLRMLLEQGLRENSDEKTRQYQDLLVNLQEEKLKYKFWYPQLQMVLKVENQRIESLRSRDSGSNSNKMGEGSFGLQLGEYTVFNWGKDHLEYLNNLTLLERKKESHFEKRRELKHQLMSLYFQLVLAKNIEQIRRDHVKHATFIYRLNREKAPIRKISQQEYLQTRSLYLNVQKIYNEGRLQTHSVEREISFTIGDPSHTSYHPEERLKFKRLELSIEESLKTSGEFNPEIKEHKANYQNSIRNIEKTFKENLPLPKFSINLGSYLHSFSQGQGNTSFNTDRGGPGGDNVELRASIDMTWDLIGEKGFLNSRERATAHYQNLIEGNELHKSKEQTARSIREYYRMVKELEQQVTIADPLLLNAQKKFDYVLENYLQKKSSFLVLKEALEDLRNSEENFEQTKYQHLLAKLELAKTMGIEDFPGENFENLAVRNEN